jgi:hypothetical protein
VSGKVGTSDWKMLIECRDRPSQGPAPASWIQQLMGRKDSLGFDKVMAASSTGFSKAAIEIARKHDICLRNLQEVSSEEIKKEIPKHAPLIIQTVDVIGMKIATRSSGSDDVGQSSVVVQNNQKLLRLKKPSKEITLQELKDYFTNTLDVTKNCKVGEEKTKIFAAKKELCDNLEAFQNGKWNPLLAIYVEIKMSVLISKIPLSQAFDYKSEEGENSQHFAEAYRYRSEDDPDSPDILMVLYPNPENDTSET